MMANPLLSSIRWYLTAVLLCLLLLTFTMKLWKADLHVPFNYSLDALFYSAVFKGTIENGWYLQNQSLGAPDGLRMHDFPIPDAVNFLLIKSLALIHSDFAWVLNVFFLLTFPLTTLCCMFALRQFGLPLAGAAVWSIIYSFLPYHFYPGISHIFNITYYTAPLGLTVALWIASGALISIEPNRTFGLNVRSRRFIASVVICLLASSVGQSYYAFFTCFFILVGAAIAVISHRRARFIWPAAVLIGVIAVGLLANLTPNLIYLARHGNPQVAQRSPGSAELYGLKIAPMVLPVRNHRIGEMANLTEKYLTNVPKDTMETSEMSALGFLGTIGFLFLLAWLFFLKRETALDANPTRRLLDQVSVLNGAAILLATIGGFSSLVALILFSQIRSYHRVTVFVEFLSLLALALLVEEFFRRRPSIPHWVRYAALFVILLVGILDQTTTKFVPAYAQNKAEFANDEAFVAAFERRLPPRAMIFQLPYFQFPEGAGVNLLTDYELFRGYLHSRNLRWSYATMKGREGDTWVRDVAGKTVSDMLETIVVAGFQGIYIDRLGYPDSGAALENQLHQMLQEPPLVSANQRLAFFDLTEFSAQMQKEYSPDEWAQKRDRVMHPLIMIWTNGCWDREGSDDDNWNWCSSSGELRISNMAPRARKIKMEMRLFSVSKESAEVRIQGPEFSDSLLTDIDGRSYSRIFVVPPGASSVSFYCTGKRVFAPADQRVLIFRIVNFRWQEE
jgi:phosphoglycerol transferase